MEEVDLLESVQLHLQAQEDIKQELLSTLRNLEQESRPPRTTLRQVHFQSSTLRHIVAEKSAILEQIAKFNSSVLPELEQQLLRAHQKAEELQSRIQLLQERRKTSLLEDLNNTEKVHQAIEDFAENLRREIQNLNQNEDQIKSETVIARAELRVLQDQFLNRRREKAKQTLEAEVTDERLLFTSRGNRRKRSRTLTAVTPPPMDRKAALRTKLPPNLG
jgi:chromosome segregation ATPase